MIECDSDCDLIVVKIKNKFKIKKAFEFVAMLLVRLKVRRSGFFSLS